MTVQTASLPQSSTGGDGKGPGGGAADEGGSGRNLPVTVRLASHTIADGTHFGQGGRLGRVGITGQADGFSRTAGKGGVLGIGPESRCK